MTGGNTWGPITISSSSLIVCRRALDITVLWTLCVYNGKYVAIRPSRDQEFQSRDFRDGILLLTTIYLCSDKVATGTIDPGIDCFVFKSLIIDY